MRAQLAVVVLALLGGCSDSPEEEKTPRSSNRKSAEGEVVLKDSADTGRETSGPEAGKPVEGPLTKPEASKQPEGDGSDGESSAAPGEQAGDPASADTQAGQASKPADTDAQQGDSAHAPAGIYERYCSACHEKGMAGAPKISDTEEWQKRFDKLGMATLVKHSVKGYRAMPAKGTCMDCSKEQLRATVEWMLDQADVEQ